MPKIEIKGVQKPVDVSEEEYEFIMNMMKNKRCKHWFNIAGHTVMISDEIALITSENIKEETVI